MNWIESWKKRMKDRRDWYRKFDMKNTKKNLNENVYYYYHETGITTFLTIFFVMFFFSLIVIIIYQPQWITKLIHAYMNGVSRQ